jgi:hypothetical protein
MHSGIALGVNIDHVATLRQQRHTRYPEPVQAALLAELAGADNITLHCARIAAISRNATCSCSRACSARA